MCDNGKQAPFICCGTCILGSACQTRRAPSGMTDSGSSAVALLGLLLQHLATKLLVTCTRDTSAFSKAATLVRPSRRGAGNNSARMTDVRKTLFEGWILGSSSPRPRSSTNDTRAASRSAHHACACMQSLKTAHRILQARAFDWRELGRSANLDRRPGSSRAGSFVNFLGI